MSLSLLRVRKDRPRPSRKIASRIEVLPAPFSPAMRLSSGENSSDRGLDAAQVLDPQLGERHRSRSVLTRLQSRIGMTTYLQFVVPAARTRQLLLPSVSPRMTLSESTAASASSR